MGAEEGNSKQSAEGTTFADRLNAPTSVMGYTLRQVLTLVMLGLANFFAAVLISMQAPFYPAEAESKGATATEYGFVFGIFELTAFITSPIYGKHLNYLGPKRTFTVGLMVAGLATIFFGLLDKVNDRTAFVSLSLLTRFIEALGQSATATATFTMTAAEFPQAVATTFAFLETFFGLGQVVGPTVGGALYEAGGYVLPFAVMGSIFFSIGILTYFVLPDPRQDVELEKNLNSVFTILKIPAVSLAAFGTVAAASSIGFLAATLEPHLRPFALSPVLVGTVFIISGGLYAISSPAWGYVCDRYIHPRYVALTGSICIFVAFLFIGPVSFIPIETTLWLVCFSLVIHGTGLGATFVSSFNLILRESIDNGQGDNIHTYGLCSGLWMSSFSLGSFVGPSVGGYLLDAVGFRNGSIFVIIVQAFLAYLIFHYLVSQKKKAKSQGYTKANLAEASPLLQEVSTDPSPSSKAQPKATTLSYGAA